MIDRSIDEVWACLTDFFNGPRLWGRSVLGVRQTSPGPLGLGSILQGRMVIFGFETLFKFVITEWDPPHGVAFSATLRPFRLGVSRYTLETIANGTKLARSGDLEMRGPLRFALPFIRPYMMRGMREASRSLKQFIESRPRSVG